MSTIITYRFEGEDLPEGHLLAGWRTVFKIEADVSPYDPGVTCGPPERCYPAEGGEVEITGVTYVLPGRNRIGKSRIGELYESEFQALLDSDDRLRESIEELLFEAAQGDPQYDADVAYDRMKDERYERR